MNLLTAFLNDRDKALMPELRELIRLSIREEFDKREEDSDDDVVAEASKETTALSRFHAYTNDFLKEMFPNMDEEAQQEKEDIDDHFKGTSFGGNTKNISEALVSAYVTFQDLPEEFGRGSAELNDEGGAIADVDENDFFEFLLDGSAKEIDDAYEVLADKMIRGSDGRSPYQTFHKFMEQLYSKLRDLMQKA